MRLLKTTRQNDRADDRHQQQNADDFHRQKILRVHRRADIQSFPDRFVNIDDLFRRAIDGVEYEKRLRQQNYAENAADRIQISQPVERFVLVQIQKHNDENDENHNRARVNQNLHGGDERRGERHVNTGERNQNADQRNRAVQRISVINERNRARNGESGEQKKYGRSNHF